MIRVRQHPQPARSYQFLAETVEELRGLVLPTGEVRVQEASELNRVEARCYVPTTWGTAILSPGDFIVVYDVGVVSAFTREQHFLLFEEHIDTLFEVSEEVELEAEQVAEARRGTSLRDDVEALSLEGVDRHLDALVAEKVGAPLPVPEVSAALRFRAMSDGSSWLPAFQAYCDRYRLDYRIEVDSDVRGGEPDFRVTVNATGAEVLRFGLGELIDCFPDGQMVMVPESAES